MADKKELIIIGASGHGKVVADIARKNGYEKISFLDDNEALQKCGGYDVIGRSEDASAYGCDFAVAVGNAKIRRKIMEMLRREGKNTPTLIHPNAVLAEDVSVGAGTVIMAGAVVNPGAKIGQGCIVNTGASVDHDCTLGDFVHVSVGAHIAGTVEIGDETWVGIGAAVSNNLCVDGGCMIGAGAVVVKNIDEAGVYIGVPARKKTAGEQDK